MKVECDVYIIGVEQHVQKTSERLRKTRYNMVECGLREVEGWRTDWYNSVPINSVPITGCMTLGQSFNFLVLSSVLRMWKMTS